MATEVEYDAGAQKSAVWVYRDTSAVDESVYVGDVSLVQMRYFADPEADPNAPA